MTGDNGQRGQGPRVALVTGCGKRDGMGRAIARRLAASGAAVVVCDKEPAGVRNRRQEIVGGPGGPDGWQGVDQPGRGDHGGRRDRVGGAGRHRRRG